MNENINIENEIILVLEREQSITLATCSKNKVTARTMSHVNDGLIIMFQTGGDSEKASQIRENPNIAFTVGNMQIEAVAEICGHLKDDKCFIEKYKVKFPAYYDQYSNIEDEILIKAYPTKITLYKYIDGKPQRVVYIPVMNQTGFGERVKTARPWTDW